MSFEYWMMLSVVGTPLMFLATVSSAQNPTPEPLAVVASVDLERYAGLWYEIARLPNRFQKQCAGEVTATYSLLDDGEIRVVNSCRTEDGELKVAEGRAKRAGDDLPNTKLKVRFAPPFLAFLPFVWGDYWIIDLAPDYSTVVIGEPERKYLWVLSRMPALEESVLTPLLEKAKRLGYDLTGLTRTRQSGPGEMKRVAGSK